MGSWDRGLFLSPSQHLELCFQNTDWTLLPKENLIEELLEMVSAVFQVASPDTQSKETLPTLQGEGSSQLQTHPSEVLTLCPNSPTLDT